MNIKWDKLFSPHAEVSRERRLTDDVTSGKRDLDPPMLLQAG